MTSPCYICPPLSHNAVHPKMGASNCSHARSRSFKVLVTIAHGAKNLTFLTRVIETYRAMALETTIVVLSEAPKTLPAGVENVVGLPSRNPWTLPFAHKQIFAQKLEDYDLFVYSEDDIGVTEGHLRAFLEVTEQLQPDEIAGFLRYELDMAGTVYLAEP